MPNAPLSTLSHEHSPPPPSEEQDAVIDNTELAKVLALNPLATPYATLLDKFPQTFRALRVKIKTSIDRPLVTVCHGLPAVPGLKEKFAVLRRYMVDNNLHNTDGRKHGSFWRKVDAFYEEKISTFGVAIDSPEWQSYLRDTVERDEHRVPPPIVVVVEPLFTSTPLVMKVFSILN